MAKTLVWVEHDNASVKDATLAAVTAASPQADCDRTTARAATPCGLAATGCSAPFIR